MSVLNLPELSPADHRLLRLVFACRFATTSQLARLVVGDYQSEAASLRQCQRHLAELDGWHLVGHLERRIGGWQRGSETTVWYLTPTGTKQVSGRTGRRQYPGRLSTSFLSHGLAVTEARVLVTETTSSDEVRVERLQGEPECWRPYLGGYGARLILKPDLALGLRVGNYIDEYFLEIDQATENPARILAKCDRYVAYQQTGAEQAALGVFPAVVWLVPSAARAQQISAITDGLVDRGRCPAGLFHTITLDQLPQLLRAGPTTG